MSLPNIIQQINSKLPLSGGMLTGSIGINSGQTINFGRNNNITGCFIAHSQSSNGASEMAIHSCSTSDSPYTGACIYLHTDKDSRTSSRGEEAGAFCIAARKVIDGTNIDTSLSGYPNGNLYWGGYNVITSKGGSITGNLLFSNCEGVIRSERNVDAENKPLYQLSLGYETHSQLGGYILLRRGDSTAYGQAGMAALCASSPDGTRKYLMCYPNGALLWNDKPVVSIIYEAGGIITYSNGLTFQWGSAYGSTTVNFPQPFSGYPIVYTTNNSVSDSSCNATTYVTGITPTYFTTYKIRGNSSNQVQDGGQFSWIALGYR